MGAGNSLAIPIFLQTKLGVNHGGLRQDRERVEFRIQDASIPDQYGYLRFHLWLQL